jgi:hypothetical protein
VMAGVAVALLGAAFMRPLLRTITFVGLGAVLFFVYLHVGGQGVKMLPEAEFIRREGRRLVWGVQTLGYAYLSLMPMIGTYLLNWDGHFDDGRDRPGKRETGTHWSKRDN